MVLCRPQITFRLCVCLNVSLDEMLYVMLCLWQHGLFHVSYHLRVTGLTEQRILSLCGLACCMTLYLSPLNLVLKLCPIIFRRAYSFSHQIPFRIPANYISSGIHLGSRITWLIRHYAYSHISETPRTKEVAHDARMPGNITEVAGPNVRKVGRRLAVWFGRVTMAQ